MESWKKKTNRPTQKYQPVESVTAGAECCYSCCFPSPFVCMSMHVWWDKSECGGEEVKV